MEYVISGREPADALRFFEEISAIPRASGNEAGVAAYLKKFAEDRGLWVKVDEYNNVIIKKPGSKTVTTAARGVFETDGALREAFWHMLGR